MNILFLTQVLPYPLDAGPKVRGYHMLRHLSQAHQVTLVSFVRPDDRPEYLAHLRGIAHAVHTVPIRRSPLRNLAAAARGLLTGLPITIVRDEMPAMAALLRRLTAETRFDVIHADQLSMAWWGLLAASRTLPALKVPGSPRPRVPASPRLLLDEHNAIYRLTERMAQTEANPLRRLVMAREARAFRRYEAAVLRACDAVLTVTEEDRVLLEALQGAGDRGQEAGDRGQGAGVRGQGAGDRGQETGDRGQETGDRGQASEEIPDPQSPIPTPHSPLPDPHSHITVLPICVDPEAVQPIRNPQSAIGNPPAILHLGTMFWPPNVAGVLWFAREVLPRVHAALPDARFVVVGKNPPAEVQALASDPRIVVTGYVADPTPWLAGADVFVVPLRAGGGMRVKILDAWLWGLPVVATPIGAEGIALRDGENILIAAGADAFAAAVVRCLADPALNARLRAAGRAWVAENYAWQTVYRKVDEVYNRLLAPKVSFQSVEGDGGHRPP